MQRHHHASPGWQQGPVPQGGVGYDPSAQPGTASQPWQPNPYHQGYAAYDAGMQPQAYPVPTQMPLPPHGAVPDAHLHGHPQHSMDGQGAAVDGFLSSVATNYIGSHFLQGGQQYVQRMQQRIGFLSGSVFNYHFAVSSEYVGTKLMMLIAPYLKKWNYARFPEQIHGGPKYRPPKADVNCPDLYIPIMAFFTYCLLASVPAIVDNKFSPDLMYIKVYRGLMGWALHMLVLKGLLYAMSLPSSLSFIEALCYSGYLFVPLCFVAVAVISGVKYASLGAWLYASISIAVFLVKSIKKMIHSEARHHGSDVSRYNYLLLALALIQFPFVHFMGP